MPKRKKRQNVPSQRKRRGTGKLRKDKVETEIIQPDNTHDEDLLQSEIEELINICNNVNSVTFDNVHSVALDHSYLADNQIVAELYLDDKTEEFNNEYIELGYQEEYVTTSIECIPEDPYDTLKKTVYTIVTSPYIYNSAGDNLQIIELYPSTKNVSVKSTIMISRDFTAKVYVHNIELSSEHDIWLGLPSAYDNITSIERLLSKLRSYTVCCGNYEQELLDTHDRSITPVGSTIEHVTDADSCQGFKEHDFGAIKGTLTYSSTVRSVSCLLLVQGNRYIRCSSCSHLRLILRKRKQRLEEKKKLSDGNTPNYMSHKYKHCFMSREELIGKISQQRNIIASLQKDLQNSKKVSTYNVSYKTLI